MFWETETVTGLLHRQLGGCCGDCAVLGGLKRRLTPAPADCRKGSSKVRCKSELGLGLGSGERADADATGDGRLLAVPQGQASSPGIYPHWTSVLQSPLLSSASASLVSFSSLRLFVCEPRLKSEMQGLDVAQLGLVPSTIDTALTASGQGARSPDRRDEDGLHLC